MATEDAGSAPQDDGGGFANCDGDRSAGTDRLNEKKQAAAGAAVSPPTLNPFANLEALNLGANYTTDGIKVKRKLLTMPMGSPDKRQFFRAMSEEVDFVARVYERPIPGELRPVPYFVAPVLHGDMSLNRVLKTVKLVRCAYHDTHSPFLWAISIGSRDNAWSRTALDIVAAAEKGYVRCVPDGRNGYAIELPEIPLGEPIWPELTRSEWFDLAFGGRVIDSFDHEVIRELRGAG